jgi:hypothetical protein
MLQMFDKAVFPSSTQDSLRESSLRYHWRLSSMGTVELSKATFKLPIVNPFQAPWLFWYRQ